MRRWALQAAATAASFRWDKARMRPMLPTKGRPIGPGMGEEVKRRHLWLPQAGPPGWRQKMRVTNIKESRERNARLKREREWHLEARAKRQMLSMSVVIIFGGDEEVSERVKGGGERVVYIERMRIKVVNKSLMV